MPSNSLETTNILLDNLSQEDAEIVGQKSHRAEIARREAFARAGEEVEQICFPESGIMSSVLAEDGSSTEVAVIGREGMTGIGTLLGDNVSPVDTYVQVDHSTAILIPAGELRKIFNNVPTIRSLLLRYAQYCLLQAKYAIASCTNHHLAARLARWLLMCHDRSDGNEISLTHEFIGKMISAQRSGVTLALHTLEGAGMIRSTRGQVTIRDRAKLREVAGDSYGPPEARYRALIAPFGK